MWHWSAHIYIHLNKCLPIEKINRKLDKIALEWKIDEIKEKIINKIKSIFQKAKQEI
jgi:hypothetical protein